ncbi:MAG: MBL fold metallo-hydrolase [Thiohalobacteraceae bacterium]
MLFKQLFEPISSTYTYLLGCKETGQAILIDPVLPAWQRDLAELSALNLKLAYTLDTHIHADHLTAAARLKRETGSRIANPALDRLPCTDTPIEEGTPFTFGSIALEPLHTPGHTDNHFAYLLDGRVFTGDALLIDACGRTDFQNGDSEALYHSITDKLFTLPDDTLVYPAHDYDGRRVSNIGQEMTRNPYCGGGKTLEEFVEIMGQLKLAYPKFIDFAVPGNRQCGVCPEGIPEDLMQYCDDVVQGVPG